jgi:hypothetical protein
MPRAEWSKAPDFAEVAEALKLPTDHIMATLREGATYVALYTPTLYDDVLDRPLEEPPVYRVGLRRDRDGILRLASIPHELPSFYTRLRALVESRLPESGGGDVT